MRAPISNTSLERLQLNEHCKIKCAKSIDKSALNAILHIKVSKFLVDSFHFSRYVEYWFKKKGWREKKKKKTANTTNAESQKSQNNPILTSQPCRHPLHLKTLSHIDCEVEHV